MPPLELLEVRASAFLGGSEVNVTTPQEAMPNTEIRIFAMIRTQGMVEDIETVLDPSVGTITGYLSGKSFRDP